MQTQFFSLFCLFFSSCSSVLGDVNPINRTEARFASKAEKKFNISAFGFGGSFCNKINIVDVNFQSNEYKNIVEARALIIGLAEMLLDEINTDLKIRDNLKNHPFDVRDIVLAVIFKPACEDTTKTLLANVALIKGNIFYDTFDCETSTFIEMHSESWEDALHKLLPHNSL